MVGGDSGVGAGGGWWWSVSGVIREGEHSAGQWNIIIIQWGYSGYYDTE